MPPPRNLGRWSILEPIGRGGQSRVYRAIDNTEGGRVCALKHIASLARQKRQRFIREVRRHTELTAAQAPNVIPILDHNLDEFERGARNGYIVMPLAETNLNDSMNLFVGRVELTLQVFREILNGVREAHRVGIVHRDIKPHNVLSLDHTFRSPLLTDFGICYVRDEERLTLPAETVGARFFMAPEQERGGVTDVDTRADLYALGKLLHFMLTGRLLFREELNKAFLDDEHKADPRLRLILDQVLSKTIVEDREGRFPDVQALILAVEEILGLSGGGTLAIPVSVDPDSGGVPVSGAPGSTDKTAPTVGEAFADSTRLLAQGNVPALRLGFDELRSDFRKQWEALLPTIESEPARGPQAAARLIRVSSAAAGRTLAMTRLDICDLFLEFKKLLESMLRLGDRRPGYLAISGVAFVPAGFLYMTACVAALRWEAWQTLRRLLRERFEWYYQAERPLYDFGFQMAYFFHSETLNRKANKAHDLFRSILGQQEYLDVLAVDPEELLSLYVQAQMVQCLRAAQEYEKDDDGTIWADFGRFHAYRVLPLLDRAHSDANFLAGLAVSFDEKPETWLRKLNARLEHIRENNFRGSPYFWDSIRVYEPR